MTASQALRRCLASFRAILNGILTRCERPGDVKNAEPRQSPVFILGAPRSGTTMVLQALIHSTDLDYFSNLQCALCGNPSLTANILKSRQRDSQEFTSSYGTTKGFGGPSECGSFWYRFFPEDPDIQPSANEMSEKLELLKTSITKIIEKTGKPLLLKNLQNVTRLPHLQYAFPGAVYINVSRNILGNASSILLARKKLGSSIHDWWSIKPHSWKEHVFDDPVEQVLFQIVTIRRTIEEFFSRADAPKLVNVRYETFCENPNEEIQRIVSELRNFGCEVESTTSTISRLRISDQFQKLNVEMQDKLAKAAESHPDIGGQGH